MPEAAWKDFVVMLSAYAPYLGEELWQKAGGKESVSYERWPKWNEELCKDNTCTIVVQVNGKIRDKFEADVNESKENLEKTALATEGAKRYLEGKTPAKLIVVPNKLVNIVVRP